MSQPAAPGAEEVMPPLEGSEDPAPQRDVLGVVALTTRLPNPWPPATDGLFGTLRSNGARLEIWLDTEGRFSLVVTTSDHTIRSYTFQPIYPIGEGYVYFECSWDPSGPFLQVQTHPLSLYEPDNETILFVDVTPWPAPMPRTLIYDGLNGALASNLEDQFFLETIRDIDHRVVDGSAYDLIRSGGMLRQMFLDSPSLLNTVNRSRRCKLSFETIRFKELPIALPTLARSREFNPEVFPGAATVQLSLDRFLATPVSHYNDLIVTVKDLIRSCANSQGGVHFGKTNVATEQAVLELDSMFDNGPLEGSLSAISDICRISLKALKPLISEVVAGR